MEKIRFNLSNIDEIKNAKKNKALSLLKDPNILYLIKNEIISDKEVYDDPYLFQDYLNNLNLCYKCQGLNNCLQKSRGYHLNVINDDYLSLVYKPCKYMKQELNDNEFTKNIIIDHRPNKFKKLKFSDINLENESVQYRNILLNVINWLNNPTYPGYYLLGDVGVGKTYIASCVINAMAQKGYKVGFIVMSEFINELKYMISNQINYNAKIKEVMELEFVVFDDFGAETMTPWVRDEILFTILNYRMENELYTFFTSNNTLDTLFTIYKDCNKNSLDEIKALRILERIKSLSKILKISGNSRRY